MATFHLTPLTRLTLIMSAVFLGFMAWIMVDLARNDRRDDQETDAMPTTGIAAPMDDFVEFATRTPGHDVPSIGLDHAYTAEGIRRLAAALDTYPATRSGATEQHTARLREVADRLRRDPRSLQHADSVRDGFATAMNIIDTTIDADTSELYRLAQSVEPDRPLLQQIADVREFFRRAADILRENPPPHDGQQLP